MPINNVTDRTDYHLESLERFDETYRHFVPIPKTKYSLSLFPNLVTFTTFQVKNSENDLRMARTALTELGLGEPRSSLSSKEQYEELTQMKVRVRKALDNRPKELVRAN